MMNYKEISKITPLANESLPEYAARRYQAHGSYSKEASPAWERQSKRVHQQWIEASRGKYDEFNSTKA